MSAQYPDSIRWREPRLRLERPLLLSQQRQRQLFRLTLLSSDVLMLLLAFALAYWLRFFLGLTTSPDGDEAPQLYLRLSIMLPPLSLLLFWAFGLYDFQYLLGGTDEYARVFNACTVGMVLMIIGTFFKPDFVISRAWLLYAWLLSVILISGARFALRRTVYRLRKYGYFIAPALIVGANDEARVLARQLAHWSYSGLHIVGLVNNGSQDSQVPADIPVLGTLSNLPGLVQEHNVKEVIVATSAVSSDQLLDLFRGFGRHEDVRLRLSSGLFGVFTTGLLIREFASVPLICVNRERLSGLQALAKTSVDYIGASVGLVVLSPLLLAIAIAIRLDTPGSVIYRRRVLGQGGRQFDAYKFRTMVVNGNARLTPQEWAELQTHHKLKEDPRITRVGRILRQYSLDELPQLLNVLKGQMSLIGPRMITMPEQGKYGRWDMNLLTVKPGLSGLWQVSGRSDVGYDERVLLDMYYIRNYSLWLDLQLIYRTIGVLVSGKGAY